MAAVRKARAVGVTLAAALGHAAASDQQVPRSLSTESCSRGSAPLFQAYGGLIFQSISADAQTRRHACRCAYWVGRASPKGRPLGAAEPRPGALAVTPANLRLQLGVLAARRARVQPARQAGGQYVHRGLQRHAATRVSLVALVSESGGLAADARDVAARLQPPSSAQQLSGRLPGRVSDRRSIYPGPQPAPIRSELVDQIRGGPPEIPAESSRGTPERGQLIRPGGSFRCSSITCVPRRGMEIRP